jgi:hypothetical protein
VAIEERMREKEKYCINFADRVVNNYYPFGMLQPGQIFSNERYRFGFIPKESGQALKDNEKINKWSNYDRRS